MINNDIKTFLNNLKNKKINYICRSCNLVDIGFGENIWGVDVRGNSRTVPEYAIHIQCPFRFKNEHRILLGSDDLYISNNEDCFVDLGEKDTSLFDDKIEIMKSELVDQVVEDVVVNNIGDLEIVLANFSISVFVTCSDENEQENYRILEFNDANCMKDTGKHLVNYSNGFSFE